MLGKGRKSPGTHGWTGEGWTEGLCWVLLPTPSIPRAVLLPGTALSDVPFGTILHHTQELCPETLKEILLCLHCSPHRVCCQELQAVQDRSPPTALTLGEPGRVRPPLAVAKPLFLRGCFICRAVRIASIQPGLCSAGSAAGRSGMAELPAGSRAVALPTADAGGRSQQRAF